jgi:hypothetical protein
MFFDMVIEYFNVILFCQAHICQVRNPIPRCYQELQYAG